MKIMHRGLLAICLSVMVLGQSQIGVSQTKPTLSQRPAKPAAKAETAPATTGLPSEDTVNSFLFWTFGYDAAITWKIVDIRPSEIPGLADVTVLVTSPQGATPNKLLVSADGKHAVTGEILPFGAKPFEEVRLKLEKGVNGTAKGPEKAP